MVLLNSRSVIQRRFFTRSEWMFASTERPAAEPHRAEEEGGPEELGQARARARRRDRRLDGVALHWLPV